MVRTTIDIGTQVAVITGAARGIGYATAEAFLERGARVAIGDIDAELAQAAAEALSARHGRRVVGLPLDVTDRASFDSFLSQTQTRFGSLDVVVNNAGIMPTGLLRDETEAMTDRMIAINLRGVITGSKLAVQRLGPGATIVNIASAAGLFGAPGLATYTATKAAVVMLTDSLRLELAGTDVHAMTVLPGLVSTELSAGATYNDRVRPVVATTPARVARAIVDGVSRRRDVVTAPRGLRTLFTAADLLPTRLRRRAERFAGLDTAYTQADPAARAAYHARLDADLR